MQTETAYANKAAHLSIAREHVPYQATRIQRMSAADLPYLPFFNGYVLLLCLQEIVVPCPGQLLRRE